MYLQTYLMLFTEFANSKIDVGLESAGEEGVIWDYPTVVDLHFLKPATPRPYLDLCSEASVLRLPATVQGIPILVGLRLIDKLPREPLLVHLPSSMHGECGLNRPHGPWTIWVLMTSKSFGSSLGAGSSAEMMSSIWLGRIFSLS